MKSYPLTLIFRQPVPLRMSHKPWLAIDSMVGPLFLLIEQSAVIYLALQMQVALTHSPCPLHRLGQSVSPISVGGANVLFCAGSSFHKVMFFKKISSQAFCMVRTADSVKV